jgi:hypothetical protein
VSSRNHVEFASRRDQFDRVERVRRQPRPHW